MTTYRIQGGGETKIFGNHTKLDMILTPQLEYIKYNIFV